jgi:hypothetical protein
MELEIEQIESPKTDISSTWSYVSYSELEISLPVIHKTRAKDEVNEVHIKHKKIIKDVTNKMGSYIKHTLKEISYENMTIIIQMIMKEVDKSGIKNADKKHIVKLIAVYILDCNSFNHVISYYTIEMIDSLIEFIYHHGLHRYKKKQKSCFCC